MSKQKRYVGNGSQRDGVDIINFSVCLSDLTKDDVFEYNGKKYTKLSIAPKNEPRYGKTHSVWIDDYKPADEQPAAAPRPAQRPQSLEDDDLPF